MSNKKKQKTNITRISAGKVSKAPETKTQPETSNKPEAKDKLMKAAPANAVKAPEPKAKTKKARALKNPKSPKERRDIKEIFILFRPFVRLGRYLKDSWIELRQVRWPSRKVTWKLTLAVLVYCAILMVFILLLDMLFTFIFDLLLKH